MEGNNFKYIEHTPSHARGQGGGLIPLDGEPVTEWVSRLALAATQPMLLR